MATIYECDRCGKSSQLIIDFYEMKLNNDEGSWDLCRDCTRLLKEWIKLGKRNIKGATK